jgi:phage terminase small subunit
MKDRKLTDKQRLFVQEYLIDLNATQAAIRAGYSKKTASRIGPELLGKTCIREALQKRRQKTEYKLEIRKEDILKGLLKIAARSMEGVEVDEESGEKRRFPYDPQMYIKATSEIAKMQSFYAPFKHDVSVDGKLHDLLLEMIDA